MNTYASQTTVDIKKSIDDIKRVLQKYKVLEGWQVTEIGDKTVVKFMYDGILCVIDPMMPNSTDRKYTHSPTGRRCKKGTADEYYVKACKAKWRKNILYYKLIG